jgi:hypothetical protein
MSTDESLKMAFGGRLVYTDMEQLSELAPTEVEP